MLNLPEFQARLEERLLTITAELNTIGYHDKQTDNWEAKPDTEELSEADNNNEADGVEEYNERRSTLAALEIEYRDIKRALRKIVDGTFGICEISKKPIEEARLQANPTARTESKYMNEEGQLPL